MTRVKEPVLGTTEVPEYKSPPSRIIRSLRTAYDNSRKKMDDKSKTIMGLRGSLRDVEQSRQSWKEKTKAAEERVRELENELKQVKKKQ